MTYCPRFSSAKPFEYTFESYSHTQINYNSVDASLLSLIEAIRIVARFHIQQAFVVAPFL